MSEKATFTSEDGSFVVLDPGSLNPVFKGFINQDLTVQLFADESIMLPVEGLAHILEGLENLMSVLTDALGTQEELF